MRLLDLTLPTPEENLALDEALLDEAETHGGPETLRFWEPKEVFVVLGYGKKAAEEVFMENCLADGVPIFRRPSGGGTVLQGPGCLNYALVLDMESRPELQSLTSANRLIMARHAEAFQALVPAVTLQGITDLAIRDQKFMGNAQRRKRRFLLFHGCILLDLKSHLLERYLRLPSERPQYRNNRSHQDFVTRFPAPSDRVRRSLSAAWDASPDGDTQIPSDALRVLVSEKYVSSDWNLRY